MKWDPKEGHCGHRDFEQIFAVHRPPVGLDGPEAFAKSAEQDLPLVLLLGAKVARHEVIHSSQRTQKCRKRGRIVKVAAPPASVRSRVSS